MIRISICGLFVALAVGLPGPGIAAELSLEFGKREIEWGKPLRGYVVYRGNTDSGAIDLSPWKSRFHIDSGYTESGEDEAGKLVRRESVRLYPRSPGRQEIPALSHAGVRSAPLEINVLEPRPERGRLSLDHRVSAERVRAGEQLTVQVRLFTRDERVRISIDPVEHRGTDTRLLASSVEPGPDGGIVHRLGWSLFFTTAGRHRLALPPVRYTLFGRDLYKFHLPLLSVEVDPLPGYVPLTVPVGRLSVASAIEEADDGVAWRVRVETDGRLPVGLPELESRLAELSGVPPGGANGEPREEARGDAVYSILEYRAPLPRWASGLGPGPVLALQVFDPEGRRVRRLDHELPIAWRFPTWFGGVVGLIAFAASLPLFRRLVRALLTWRERQALISAVNRAQDVSALRRLLLAHSGCRTLGEWGGRNGGGAAGEVAARLNAACFGPPREVNPTALKQALVRIIRGRPGAT